MTDHALLDADRRPLPLPPDPPSPVPDEVGPGLSAYRAGDVQRARELLGAVAGAGRTSVSGHAAMALAGVELDQNGLDGPSRKWLKQVVTGEDPWLGPLAAVLLTTEFLSAADRSLIQSLAAQLTGDADTARAGFESAAERQRGTGTGDAARLLLGNLLLHGGEDAAALKALQYVRSRSDGVFAAYAGHLEGHALIGQDEKERAGEVLQYARRESHPARGGDAGLFPWIAVRLGELLAGDAWLDLVHDQIERSGVSEGTVIREPFEAAHYQSAVSSPALADIGLFLFPADFEPVHAALERLKTWSGERYDRARRLILALHPHVEDGRDTERTRGLAGLWTDLDLPRPR
ncbi:tetratricopeptide repeat protein [Actinomadura sp. 21ATH]|uniref:tetratricopeptide repeat protein n=1 Tax=Actinomadura sp. 21ATH TaxID=1735444 RepID=UPI0035C0A7CC